MTRRNVTFQNADYEMLLELFRVLPDVKETSVDTLLNWADGNGVLGWFDAPEGNMPAGWRFRNGKGGWAGQ